MGDGWLENEKMMWVVGVAPATHFCWQRDVLFGGLCLTSLQRGLTRLMKDERVTQSLRFPHASVWYLGISEIRPYICASISLIGLCCTMLDVFIFQFVRERPNTYLGIVDYQWHHRWAVSNDSTDIFHLLSVFASSIAAGRI